MVHWLQLAQVACVKLEDRNRMHGMEVYIKESDLWSFLSGNNCLMHCRQIIIKHILYRVF